MVPGKKIRGDLTKIGVGSGSKLIVHSSYKAVGKIDGGPASFLKVLLT